MAEVLRILGQLSPSATTWETIYTVPTHSSSNLGKSPVQTIISTIIYCNVSGSVDSYSIRVVPSGETAAAKHNIFHERYVYGEVTEIITPGITMNSGDFINVYTDSGNGSFSVFGVETH